MQLPELLQIVAAFNFHAYYYTNRTFQKKKLRKKIFHRPGDVYAKNLIVMIGV